MLKVELISHTDNAAHLCGEAAAICTNSDKPESALCHALDSGHTSILEHAVFTFRIEGLSRAALAQLTMFRVSDMSACLMSMMFILMKVLYFLKALRNLHSSQKPEALWAM